MIYSMNDSRLSDVIDRYVINGYNKKNYDDVIDMECPICGEYSDTLYANTYSHEIVGCPYCVRKIYDYE